MQRLFILLSLLVVIFIPSRSTQAQTPHTVFYINDAFEVIALNPITSEQKILRTLENPAERTRAYGIHPSPDGTALAVFVRTSDFSIPDEQVRLYVIRVTDAALLLEQNLFPEGYIFPADAPLRDPNYELTRAVGEIVWSPDSRSVAFVSGHTGNAEVFAYDVPNQTLLQVSNLPQTAAFLHWSPDNQTLIFSEVVTFGTGSGDEMAGVYAANLTNGTVQPLNFGDERIQQITVLGWLDSQTFWFSPLNFLVGANGIYSLNLTTGTAAPLLPYEVEITVPIYDSATGAFAFVVPDVGIEQILVKGAYLLTSTANAPVFLQSGTFYFAQRVREGVFQFEGADGSFLTNLTTPQLTPIPASDFGAFVSPGADAVVLFRSDGVYLSNLSADNASLVLSGEIQVPLWSSDGNFFYTFGFTSEGAGLLQFDAINRTVRLLDSRMAINSPIAIAG